MSELHGTTTIKGNNPFRIPAEDFIISPVSADTKLYIRSIANGVVDAKEAGDIKADEYTKVHGAVSYVEFYVDTTDTFYVKW